MSEVSNRRVRVKVAMLEAGVKSSDIVRRCRVSPSLVSQVIGGTRRSPRIEAAISKAVRIPRSELWTPSAN